MDMSLRVVPLHLHPLGLIESFIHFGADIDGLLANTHINKQMLYEKNKKISYLQLNTLIKNGIKACKTPGLGLLVGSHMDWSYQGSVGSAVSCSPSLKEAFNAYFRFFCIAQPFHLKRRFERSFFVDPNNKIVSLLFTFGPTQNDPSLNQFETEFQLATILRLCEISGNKTVEDTSVHACVSYTAPSHTPLYRSLPCTNVTFSCKQSCVSANIDFIIKPWREFRRGAYQRTLKTCESELINAGIAQSLSNQVRWSIGTHYFHRHICIENIAEDLHTTPRSLARRLGNEYTTFRKLYHEVRMELTLQHLRYSRLSVEDIAELMRFSSVSSLRRAVKNWSGRTIKELRDLTEKNQTSFTGNYSQLPENLYSPI